MSGSVERIVALDLGKFKSVACVMEAADRSTAFATRGAAETGACLTIE